MTIREAFAVQLDVAPPLTQAYFDISDEDLRKPNPLFQNMPEWTDETLAAHKVKRLKTFLGGTKQIGDRILYAILLTDHGEHLVKSIEVFVDRELPQLEKGYTVVGAGATLPMITAVRPDQR